MAGLDFYRTTQNGVYYYVPYDTISTRNPGNAYTNITPSRIEQIKAAGQSGPYNNINSENIYAAYVSDVFNLADNLIVNAALRVDRFDNKASYDPVAATWSGGYQQTAVSPKFGVVYQPVKDQCRYSPIIPTVFKITAVSIFPVNHSNHRRATKPKAASNWMPGDINSRRP